MENINKEFSNSQKLKNRIFSFIGGFLFGAISFPIILYNLFYLFVFIGLDNIDSFIVYIIIGLLIYIAIVFFVLAINEFYGFKKTKGKG